jgi:hypothetical protein
MVAPHTNNKAGTCAQLITLLNIPTALSSRSGAVDACLAYSKYKGVLQAQKDLQRMMGDGSWPFKAPHMVDIIECFVSKFVWHEQYNRYFPKIRNYPKVLQWLEGTDDSVEGLDIFGIEKPSYSFADLKDVIDELEKNGKKGKKRARDAEEEVTVKKKGKKASGSKLQTS